MGLEQHPGGGLTLWAYRLVAPYTFDRVDIPDKTPESLGDLQVLLRFIAAGVCGSDLPGFRGTKGRLPGDTGLSAAEMDGFPVHEVVGEVIASRHPRLDVGDRVVGWASGFDGLMERVVADGDGLAQFDPALSPQHAVALQPLACVLYALEQLPTLEGSRVAVIGQGSIGLLFSYAAKALGASHVTGVDPIDRDGIGKHFGVDTVVRATSDRWVSHLEPGNRPDIVIEAVGHQVATLGHAIEAAAFGGTVLYFGVPDDDSYPISMRTMLRNNLTLKSGVTLDRRRMLCAANEFARKHPELLTTYVTHTFGIDEIQASFELAGRPTPDRIKIAIVA
jgi:threonine dehydrogenase-like Zn-dependent dehydrogenase